MGKVKDETGNRYGRLCIDDLKLDTSRYVVSSPAKNLGNGNQPVSNKTQDKQTSGETGRPETPDEQKSDKTLANKKAMS